MLNQNSQSADKIFDEKTFQHQLRPAWTPVNVALMILFFVAGAWPLGLLAIAYMMYGKEMGLDFSNWGRVKSSARNATRGFKWTSSRTAYSSGNAAFDEWREAELDRLNEERRKLDEAREAFDAHMKELRMARDREEFDAFQRAWDEKRRGDTPAE